MIQAQQLPQPRIRNARSARSATETRIVHNNRARYSNIVRVSAVLSVVLAMLLGYVWLTSNVTGLTYAIAQAQANRDRLEEETARLDDQLANLRSEERLAHIAAQLGMHEQSRFALVTLDAPTVASNDSLAMLSSLTGLFDPISRTRER